MPTLLHFFFLLRNSYLLRLFLYHTTFLLFPCACVWENTHARVSQFPIAILSGTCFFPTVDILYSERESWNICALVNIYLNFSMVIGCRDFFLSCRFTSFNTHAYLLTFFVCLFVLFHSCSSHARMFGKTLMHDFPISYSHAERYLLYSRNEMIFEVEESHFKKTNCNGLISLLKYFRNFNFLSGGQVL